MQKIRFNKEIENNVPKKKKNTIPIQLQINSKKKNHETIKVVVVGEQKLEEALWRHG